MGNYKEDTNQDLRTIFFIIIFSLFVLSSSNIQGNHYPVPTEHTTQTELVFGSNSIHHNALICDYFNFPDLQKFSHCDIQNTCFNPFSLKYKLSNYNSRTDQILVNLQKTSLTFEPLLLWRLYNTLSLSDKGDLPVLS
jgi:hypothetical protein